MSNIFAGGYTGSVPISRAPNEQRLRLLCSSMGLTKLTTNSKGVPAAGFMKMWAVLPDRLSARAPAVLRLCARQ
jgi:hypothetical protein